MKWERDGKIYREIRRTMLADLHSLIARLGTGKGRDTRARRPDAGVRTEPGERRGHGGPGAGAGGGPAKDVPPVPLREASELHGISVVVLLATVI